MLSAVSLKPKIHQRVLTAREREITATRATICARQTASCSPHHVRACRITDMAQISQNRREWPEANMNDLATPPPADDAFDPDDTTNHQTLSPAHPGLCAACAYRGARFVSLNIRQQLCPLPEPTKSVAIGRAPIYVHNMTELRNQALF